MYVRELVQNSFVLIQSSWPVKKARQIVRLLSPSHVIVHRTDPKDYYYLYTLEEAMKYLAATPDEMSIHDAFSLREFKATPSTDGYVPAETAPDRVVVVEEGHVIGFRDTTAAITASAPRRGVSE